MDFSRFDQFLGNALYEARAVQRITQEEMADAISRELKKSGKKKGITRSAYSYYEKGDRSMPSDVFTCACNILGLDENKVFNDACDYVKR